MENNTFTHNITSIYGNKGQEWLGNLPNTVSAFSKRWDLSGLKPFDNLSYNYVLSGFQEDLPIILKLGIDTGVLNREVMALEAFKGFGAVEVINQADGALLLECASPGYSLKQFFPDRDAEAIIIVSGIINKLHQAPKPASNDFPPIKDWLVSLDKPYAIFEEYLVKARVLRNELLNTMETSILLHGDLHHENILAHGAEWKIIDPKGVMGERAYEVGCFMRNPLHDLQNHLDCLSILKNRISAFSKYLNLDPKRIAKWFYVQTMLSIIWSYEDNLSYEDTLKSLLHLDQLLD